MEIADNKLGSVTVIVPEGRLDAETARIFEQRWSAFVERGDRRFLLDLDKLSYVSSAGLRVLLIAAKQVRELSGTMFACRLNPRLEQIFTISGFTRLIPTRPTIDAAVEEIERIG
jgi:anti-anti-sigma factor